MGTQIRAYRESQKKDVPMHKITTFAIAALFAATQLSAVAVQPAKSRLPVFPKPAVPAKPATPVKTVMPVKKAAVPVKAAVPAKAAIPAVKPMVKAPQAKVDVKATAPAKKIADKPAARPQPKKAHADAKKPASKPASKPAAKNAKANALHWSSSSSSSSSYSSSSSSDDAYVGAYTENLDLNVEFNPEDLTSVLVEVPDSDPYALAMIFDTNETGSPRNVTHPVLSDYTKFRIDESGTYLVTWAFTIGCIGEGECANGAFVQLYDAAFDVPLHPNPFQFIDTENVYYSVDSEVISGQQIIRLNQGTQLQLRIIPAFVSYGALWVANPSFTLSRIAD